MIGRPIGVFDSGVGGLNITIELMNNFPNEYFYYLGDLKNCPYGNKTKSQIIQYTKNAVEFFIKNNAKIIIIACNTATAAALDIVKNNYDIPILGVIKSGVKDALIISKTKRILILGTNFTIKSKIYENELKKIDESMIIYSKACQPFVDFIENKEYINKNKLNKILFDELEETKKLDFDTIVLACTHFKVLKNAIENYYGGNKKIIFSGDGLISEVKDILKIDTINNKNFFNNCKSKIFVTKENNNFKNIASDILHKNLEIEKIDL